MPLHENIQDTHIDIIYDINTLLRQNSTKVTNIKTVFL